MTGVRKGEKRKERKTETETDRKRAREPERAVLVPGESSRTEFMTKLLQQAQVGCSAHQGIALAQARCLPKPFCYTRAWVGLQKETSLPSPHMKVWQHFQSCSMPPISLPAPAPGEGQPHPSLPRSNT